MTRWVKQAAAVRDTLLARRRKGHKVSAEERREANEANRIHDELTFLEEKQALAEAESAKL